MMQTPSWVKGMHGAIVARYNISLAATTNQVPLVEQSLYKPAYKTAERLAQGEKGVRWG
jgi:hypothetical protein